MQQLLFKVIIVIWFYDKVDTAEVVRTAYGLEVKLLIRKKDTSKLLKVAIYSMQEMA